MSRNRSDDLRRGAGSLLLLLAFVLIPGSLASRLKPGGLANSFYANYFFIVAAYAMLLDFVSSPTATPRRLSAVRGLFVVATGLCLFLARHTLGYWRDGMSLALIKANTQELAYELAKSRPGMFYFPWSPLSSLLGEGKLYHFGDAVWGRVSAGYPPTPEHFYQHVPANVHFLAWFDAADKNTSMQKYFPTFTESITIQQLPKFQVFTSPETMKLMKSKGSLSK